MEIFELTNLDISALTYGLLGNAKVRYNKYFSTLEFVREYVTDQIGPVTWVGGRGHCYFRTKDTSYAIDRIELVK